MGQYDDLIHQEPPVSSKRSRMKLTDRAKQFTPFAALKGYEAAIHAQEQQYTPQQELSDVKKAEINRILCQVQCGDEVSIDYYRSGAYHTIKSVVRKIDQHRHRLVLDEIVIGMDSISDIRVDGISTFDDGC